MKNLFFKKKKIIWIGSEFFYRILPNKFVIKIKNIFIKRIFIIYKGYNILKKKNKLDIYHKIIEDYEIEKLDIDENKFSPLILDKDLENKQLIVKQFLQSFLLSQNRRFFSLTRSILYVIGKDKKLIFPAPYKILKILNNHEIQIDYFKSAFFWKIFICFFYLYGILKVLKLITLLIINLFNFKKINYNNSAFFYQLIPGFFDFTVNEKNFFSFFTNYNKNTGNKIHTISHDLSSVKNFNKNFRFVKNQIYYPKLIILDLIKYIFWAISAIIICFIDLIRGRWWNPILLYQSSEQYLIKLINKKYIHDIYLFNNTFGFARPLWTYEVEKKKSKIAFFFYSLNYYPITYKEKSYKPNGLIDSNWNNFFVWNKLHEQKIKDQCKNNFKTLSIFPNFYSINSNEFNIANKNFLTVFDVTPLRKSYYNSLLLPQEHYTKKHMVTFLNDIFEICKIHNLKLILKTKRINYLADKNYTSFLKNLSKDKNFILLDDSISSISLIKKSQFIVAYPFTSTNHIANYFNIKNCYYMPSNKYRLDNDLAFGNKIIYNKDDLNKLIIDSIKN